MAFLFLEFEIHVMGPEFFRLVNEDMLMYREKGEIEEFVKDAVAAGEDCLGRCLYISGVPGTGKVIVGWLKVNDLLMHYEVKIGRFVGSNF
jgi:hypothetical protein